MDGMRRGIVEIERRLAAHETAFARRLRRLDPSWGTEVFALADGVAVLGGPGLFVNRLLAAGSTTDLASSDLDEFARRCRSVGVAPTIELTEATSAATVDLLELRGRAHGDRISVLECPLDGDQPIGEVEPAPGSTPTIEPATTDSLAEWQRTSRVGTGLSTERARAANDLFGEVGFSLGEHYLLARSPTGDAIGCAMLRLDGDMAVLGAASTIPSARRTGVQGALIRHRLRMAREAGCRSAISTAVVGGASERNLRRHGFRPHHTKTMYVLDEHAS